MSIALIFFRLRILIATLWPVNTCSATFTLPNEPTFRVRHDVSGSAHSNCLSVVYLCTYVGSSA